MSPVRIIATLFGGPADGDRLDIVGTERIVHVPNPAYNPANLAVVIARGDPVAEISPTVAYVFTGEVAEYLGTILRKYRYQQ